MKDRRKLSLNSLFEKEISSLFQIKGGAASGSLRCTCGCHYANSGGSSTCDNSNANFSGSPTGLHSIGGGYGCKENDLTYQQFWLCC